ncbi:hypothetical protein GRZ55_20610 [Chelativorans sp. ZYF759]|uniref:hypothetical protein n=1 Tax=Chelativorans sp. ZYF759 TaxID=2692213 RepID=UPI00145DD39B|nr:hypothetical protein [Chelativorans sp. ZYF759]NMG41646.1 hypothetical protein [Chelativorans sp. ZYF759]
MNPNTKELEREILRAFKCACRQNRPDIAEFMLAALEQLDQEQSETLSPSPRRALLDAFLEIANQKVGTKDAGSVQ